MTAEQDGLDPAAVQAEHDYIVGFDGDMICDKCDTSWPCPPYRLALALQSKMAGIEADHAGHRKTPIETTYLRACLDCKVTFNVVPADQPKRVQPTSQPT